mmetsp:Transcript_17941/g.30015  ORF Transcript_17941/g.30015 Transcript_17941/m.30015 type:complete len:296 (+) Transcript_17941:124-1011(+)
MEGKKKQSERKQSWIDWFCSLPQNHFFCRINKSYIQDNFNLFDLKLMFPSESSYKEALKIILDEASIRKSSAASSQENAEHLYGMIHCRYIKCAAGLEAMKRKYIRGDFGCCPRYGCSDHLVVPMGLSEEPGLDDVKVFCPKCQNVYSCANDAVDGAYFGPTFPHLFYMTYDALVPDPISPSDKYQPRVFGFKVHASSSSLPSSKNFVSETPSASTGDSSGEFSIDNIKAHNPVVQHVDAVMTSIPSASQNISSEGGEQGRKRCLSGGNEFVGDMGGVAGSDDADQAFKRTKHEE